jgi:hypothetical protein
MGEGEEEKEKRKRRRKEKEKLLQSDLEAHMISPFPKKQNVRKRKQN